METLLLPDAVRNQRILNIELRQENNYLRDLLHECRKYLKLHSPCTKPFEFPRELLARIDLVLTPSSNRMGSP